jgi:hypothetical protein
MKMAYSPRHYMLNTTSHMSGRNICPDAKLDDKGVLRRQWWLAC